MSREFQSIFGNADELLGDEAVIISNMDCSSENILFLEDGRIKIIDYEWFFPFPIPVDFVFYRVLWIFYERNPKLIEWESLLQKAKVQVGNVALYDKMLNNFNEYVSLDKDNNVYYGTLGKQFIEPKINVSNVKPVLLYRFPEESIPQGSKIVLYGAGKVGTDYSSYISTSKKWNMVAWIDKKASIFRKQGMNIVDMTHLKNLEYDYLLISVLRENTAKEILTELQNAGIDKSKIIWVQPEKSRGMRRD